MTSSGVMSPSSRQRRLLTAVVGNLTELLRDVMTTDNDVIGDRSAHGSSSSVNWSSRAPTYVNNTDYDDVIYNQSYYAILLEQNNNNGSGFNASTREVQLSVGKSRSGWTLNEIQLIKAIVLMVVVALLLLSTCTFVFRTFSVFSSKKDEH